MNEQILCSKCEDEAQNVCSKCGVDLYQPWLEGKIKYLETKNIEDTLPDTLHGLLKVALDDIETISEKEEYRIYMGAFHGGFVGGPGCAVSLAGSVIAKLVDYDSKNIFSPSHFKDSIDRKLVTIESLRTLDLDEAFCHLDTDNKKWGSIAEVFRIRDELEYLEAWFKAPGYSKIMWFENFKKSIKVYRDLQTKLKALGV